MVALSSPPDCHPEFSHCHPERVLGPFDDEISKQARGDIHSPYFCAAIITTPHGLHGQVKVKSFLEDPTCFVRYSPFYNEARDKEYTVTKIFPSHKGGLILTLKEVTTRTDAEQLKGATLMLPRKKLPALAEDTFYHADLIGLEIVTPDGHSLGNVHALYNFGASDILEVKTLLGKLVMIPFTRAILPEVDIKKGILRVSQEGERVLTGETNGD